jgi:hypothetical protein
MKIGCSAGIQALIQGGYICEQQGTLVQMVREAQFAFIPEPIDLSFRHT